MRNNKLLESLLPFLAIGLSIAITIGLFIVLSYVVFWGVIIGAVLWLGMSIKNKFFPNAQKESHEKGRVIEHDEIK